MNKETTKYKNFSYPFWIKDHHVHVEERFGDLWPEALDDWMPEGQVRHEVAVHNVQVEVVGTAV